MEKTLRVLNRMVKDGVIEQYAIGGAVAAIFCVEPINTNDLDVFFDVGSADSGLTVLAPLYDYLSSLGYNAQGETVEIEEWPVQLLPAYNPLVEKAVEQAKSIKFNEHRVLDRKRVGDILKRHSLNKKWKIFEQEFLR